MELVKKAIIKTRKLITSQNLRELLFFSSVNVENFMSHKY